MSRRCFGIALTVGVLVASLGCAREDGSSRPPAPSVPAASAAAVPADEGRFYDEGRAVRPTPDGGFLVAGETSSKGAGAHDVWLLKLDANGQLEWERTYGTAADERAAAVARIADGGFVVAAVRKVEGSPEREDGWIFKVDPGGNVLWDRTYGGGAFDRFHAVVETADGGFVAAGATASKGAGGLDGWVIKADKDGNVQWDAVLGEDGSDELRSVRQARDGGFVAGGSQTRKGAVKANGWVVRLEQDGRPRWERTPGGDRYDEIVTVSPTVDGGVIAAGMSQSNAEELSNVWVVLLDAGGALRWERQYGGSLDDTAGSVLETSGGGFVVCGKASRELSEAEAIVERSSWGVSKSYLSSDLWVIELGKSGEIAWERKYGGNNESCADIAAAPGGYVLAGWTGSKARRRTDLWVVAIDGAGEPLWDRVFGD